jgi:hypothetical protein
VIQEMAKIVEGTILVIENIGFIYEIKKKGPAYT